MSERVRDCYAPFVGNTTAAGDGSYDDCELVSCTECDELLFWLEIERMQVLNYTKHRSFVTSSDVRMSAAG